MLLFPPPRKAHRHLVVPIAMCLFVPEAYSRTQSKDYNLDISGEIRIGYVTRDNAGDSNKSFDFLSNSNRNDNDFLYTRSSLSVALKADERTSARVTIRDQRAFGDQRDPSPREDWIDLYEAYLDVGLTDVSTLRLGRQEVAFGSRLIVGTPNYRDGRSYDAVHLKLKGERHTLNAAIGRQVERDRASFNLSSSQPWMAAIFLDSPASHDDHLSWDSTLAFKHQNTDSRNPIDIGTWGIRLKSPKSISPWFWSAEAAYQFGSINRSNERLDHAAWLFQGRIGRKFADLPGSPTITLEYLHSPGDSDSNDGKSETWDLMFFGGAHPRSGRMDLTGWRNIQYLALTTQAKPYQGVTVGASTTGYWIENTQDGFYAQGGNSPRNRNGYGIRPEASKDIGWEFMLWAKWKHKAGFSLLIEAGHFAVGDYVEESLAASGGAENAQLLSITGGYKF